MTGQQAVEALIARRLQTRFGVTGNYNGGRPTGDWGQCTAVPHSLQRDVLGIPIVYGNAVDVWSNAPDKDYEKIPVNGVAKPGDIVVWGQNREIGTTEVGHIAVIEKELGNGVFQSIDQNWPTGAWTQRCIHSRVGVIGFLRPKVYSGGGNVNDKILAIQGQIFRITGNWHSVDDILKNHINKSDVEVDDTFFRKEPGERERAIRGAGQALWGRAFGEDYPEEKVKIHMGTRKDYPTIVGEIASDVIEEQKRRNSGLGDTDSTLDKIAAFVLSLKRNKGVK